MSAHVETYRTADQVKFVRVGWSGLLTIADHGTFGVSGDHKQLFTGLKYDETHSGYWAIRNPSSRDRAQIFNALYGLTQ